jgi:MoxR-like ATPase
MDEITPVISAADIAAYKSTLSDIIIDEKLLGYIAEIVNQTRSDQSIYLGASPRASLALLNGSRAFAAIQGRDFVTPEDIKFLAGPVLKHRIILTPEKEMEGISAAEVIQQLVAKTEVPR